VLVLGCGGGQDAIALARWGAQVVGIDVSDAQIEHARKLAEKEGLIVPFVQGNIEELPQVENESQDLVVSAHALEYGEGIERCFAEVARVLKPGGEAGILEFALPKKGLFARLYGVYFRRVLPWIGRVISGVPGPYSYLPVSVEKFPDCDEFVHWMEAVGFASVSYQLWTGGTVALYRGVRGKT